MSKQPTKKQQIAKARRKRQTQAKRGRLIAGLTLAGWGTCGDRLTDGKRISLAYREQGKIVVAEPITNGIPLALGDGWGRIATPYLRAFHNAYVTGAQRVQRERNSANFTFDNVRFTGAKIMNPMSFTKFSAF